MAGMVVSAATGVLSSLLSELSDLLTDLYKQRKGVRRDIEFLCSELTDMNGALEKLAGMEKLDIQTKVWRDKVREMAYDIEDSVDIFMHVVTWPPRVEETCAANSSQRRLRPTT